MTHFQERFQAALRRRLYPQTPLHLKQIARAIGRSENTVTRWWRGETRVLGEDLHAIARFFLGRGDRSFLAEVFGDAASDAVPATGADSAVLGAARDMLLRAAETLERETHCWFMPEAVAPAPQGHGFYVQRTLGLPSNADSASAYAMRVLGWIALSERDDGEVIIRHDGKRVDRTAAEMCCAWLYARTARIRQVRRAIQMNRQWIETTHASAPLAAAAIEKVAFITVIRRQPWRVSRLPLDEVRDPRLAALLQAYGQEPQRLVHTAAEMGAFTTSNLFGIVDDDVISHHIGTGLGFDPSAIEGFNLLCRPDTEYALMVQARILRARDEGPAYYELEGTIDNRYAHYLNLVLPEPQLAGRVLTSTVVLDVQTLSN